MDSFDAIINNPLMIELTFYLETPNEMEGYAAEITLLRGMKEN